MLDGERLTGLGASSGKGPGLACQDNGGDQKSGRENMWLCRLQIIPVAQFR